MWAGVMSMHQWIQSLLTILVNTTFMAYRLVGNGNLQMDIVLGSLEREGSVHRQQKSSIQVARTMPQKRSKLVTRHLKKKPQIILISH